MAQTPRLRELALETKESLQELSNELQEAEDIEGKLESIIQEDEQLFEMLEEERVDAREAEIIENMIERIEQVRQEVGDLYDRLTHTEEIFGDEEKEALRAIQD